LSAAAAIAALAIGASARAAVGLYSITPLDSLPDTADVFVDGVNTSGQIVGYTSDSTGASHGALWNTAGGVQELPYISTNHASEVYRINNLGQIVGKSMADTGSFHATLWTVGGATGQDLGTLPSGNFSFAMDINDNGVVAGSSKALHGQHAFTWTAGGGMVDNGSQAPNANSAIAGWNGINNNGQVVGTSYVILSPYKASYGHVGDAMPTQMSPIGQFSNGMALAVNDAGTMVGWQSKASGGSPHAAIFHGDGTFDDLGTLGADQTDSWASDVNELGVIVGRSFGNDPNTGDLISKAFIREPGGEMTELATLLTDSTGWTVMFEANAISDNGYIVGTGVYNGEIRGFVLTPVPEPAALSGAGMLAVALLRRRRRV
jgi:probable HAF family extracellular repeat protein